MKVEFNASDSAAAPSCGNKVIRIVLVENHALLREGIKALIGLEPDLEVVGDFGSVEACLARIVDLQPTLVVTDLSFHGRCCIDLLEAIGRLSPETRRIVLTAHDHEEYIRAALGQGAHGYVLKDASSVELMQSIRTVASGQQFLCKAIASKVLLGYLSGDARTAARETAPAITGREREVLMQIAHGGTNKAIARDLGLSPKTVEKHRSNLMRKLQLRNAAGITMYAVRNGMMSNPAAHTGAGSRRVWQAAAQRTALSA